MKIAIFTDTYYPQVNGIATSVKILTDHLKKAGHKVIIFAPKLKNSKGEEPNVIRINSVKVFPHLDELRLPIILRKSLKEINSFDFDIVHAHGNAFFSLLGFFAARRKGVPFLLTFHTFMSDYTHYIHAGKKVGEPIVNGIYKFYGSLCDAIIAPSVKMKNTLLKSGVKKTIYVVPNFIEIKKFSISGNSFIQKKIGLKDSTPVLLFVGRIAKEKNIKFLISTFADIHKESKDVHLAIAGAGPEREAMEKLITSLGISEYVHFLGIVESEIMPKIFASSTLFVFPSTSEVHPMVAIEAAASGLPIIAAEDDAFEGLVENGKNGYLLPLKADLFREKILEVVSNRKEREKLSLASRKIATENFSEGKIIHKFEDVYNNLVSNNKNRPVRLVRESKLRILIATDVFYPTTGGVPVAIVALSQGLMENGHEVLLIAPSNSLRTYKETYEDIKVVRVGSIPINNKRSLRLTFNIFEISYTMRDFSPDVVHICTPGVICENAVGAAKKKGIALVGTNHVIEDNLLSPYHLPKTIEDILGNFLFGRILNLYKKLDKVAAPSPFAAKHFIAQGLVDVQAISNGVHLKNFQKKSEQEGKKLEKKLNMGSKKIVLYVGRLDKEKRVDVLIRAVADIKNIEFKLAIAGDGVDGPRLQKLAKSLKIENKVAFLGYIGNDHLQDLYSLADIFVMPGDAELQSISTLEAMACGLPVVACDAKALPDLVEHGVNGFLYEKNNHLSLSKFLKELLLSAELQKEMGKAGYLKVQEHDMPKTIAKYEDIYIDAINEKNEKKQIEVQLKGFKFNKFLVPFSVAIIVIFMLSYYVGFNMPGDIKAAPGRVISKVKAPVWTVKGIKNIKTQVDRVGVLRQ